MTTLLDRAYHWEKTTPGRVYLTQPVGGGEVREITWKQALEQARQMAAHLRSLKLGEPSQIAIFTKNTAWFIIADLAIWMAGHVSVPLYPTLTPETIGQILEHSESKLIFVGKLDGYDGMKAGIPADLPRIALPLSPPLDDPKWDDVIAEHEPIADSPTRDPETLATLIYTSGSTGVPKGVMLSFKAMYESAVGLKDYLDITDQDRCLSYLPLAHSMERWCVESASLNAGFSLFFAESLDTFVKDLKRAKPTMFVSVPRLWLKFQLGIFKKMPPGKLAFYLKIPILGGIVRRKILSGLGLEAARFAGSGSAPIPADVIQWYRDLGLELLEGYGMTENFAYSHCSKPGRTRAGYVGHPYPDVQHRISEEGEILVKSPGMMMGYFKEPEMTAEVLTDDAFLKTGDRGEIDQDGRLKITGRVKELFKTSKGKYVAPAPIENKLLVHPMIELACVGGNGFPQPHGVVMLSEEATERAKTDAGREEIARALGEHLAVVNRQLDHHEHLGFLSVAKDAWAVENGFLTPTMKLKRAKIEDAYGEKLDEWYEAKKPVLFES